MSYQKTGNDEITFEFEPTAEQVQGMKDLGLTEKDIVGCIEQLLSFLYSYNPSLLTIIKARQGKPDKKIENKLLEIAGATLGSAMQETNSEKIHKLAGLLLGVFFALVNEMEQYKKGDKR